LVIDWLNAVTGFDMSMHGWIALAIGAVGVALLNVGLMWLATRRWDPDADDPRAPPEE